MFCRSDSPAKKAHVLQIDMSGRFAVNVVDNLIIVHHQTSKVVLQHKYHHHYRDKKQHIYTVFVFKQTSMVFDIKQPPSNMEGDLKFHRPVVPPLPMKPFTFAASKRGAPVTGSPRRDVCELYSPDWVLFQPDVIIDAKLGNQNQTLLLRSCF